MEEKKALKNMEKYLKLISSIAIFVVMTAIGMAAEMPKGKPNYPISKIVDVVDTLFGHIIPDPYRWLEFTDNADVQKWTDEQNALTRSYLDNIPERAKIKSRFETLWNYAKQSTPTKRDNRYFFTQNTGLQNHDVLCAKTNLADTLFQVVIDPNAWSVDGTDAMDYWIPSEDGNYVAYGHSEKGQERGRMRIRDVANGNDLPEYFDDTSYPTVAWLNDNSGFYYTKMPAKGTVPEGDENYFEKIYFHHLGDNPSQDRLIYERPDIRELGIGGQLSKDNRFLIVTAFYGSSSGNEVYYKDLTKSGEFKSLVSGFNYRYTGDIIDSVLFLMTNEGASKYRIIALNLFHTEKENWKTIIPEGDDIIEEFAIINNRLVVKYLHNACSVVKIFSLEGTFERQLNLPPLGTVGAISGRWNDPEMFVFYQSFTCPGTVFRYDFEKNELGRYFQYPVKVNPNDYEAKQVWYKSKDGTSVSMFIVNKKGIALNGNNPTLLYGYGGFTSNETPYFSSTLCVWLDMGGVYALPNLRGGGEYGESWHRAGMLDKKQNVFDDFIAAAQWLIDNKYTNPKKLAISGGSNGGLLVGAVMVQRPDLFKAVICGAPLLDMVRYHLFNIARFWISEYGSSENATQLPYILAYSPYHNVKKGAAYPAVLFQSGEVDWRTHAMHPRKMVAAMQAATSSDAPILLDMERKTGHGWGMPLGMQMEKKADEYAFLYWQLGIK